MKYAIGGTTIRPIRPIQVVALSDTWNFRAMMSFMQDSVRIA